MDLKKILLGCAAVSLMASCSDDLVNDNGIQNLPEGTAGYISVKINLPQTKKTRALDDQFNDGTANEYQVNSAVLLVFEGSDEANATQVAAYSLSGADIDNDQDNDNVTDSYQYLKTVAVNKAFTEGTNTYGLVMLNYDGVGTINNGKFEFLNGTPVTNLASLQSASKVNDNLVNFIGTKKDNFFMTNIPASTLPGTDEDPGTGLGNIQTLVDLTNGIYNTPDLARQNPAGSFFVERAVAKATLTKSANISAEIANAAVVGDNATGTAADVLTIGDVKWGLSNTEATSFFVRNMGTGEYMAYNNSKCASSLGYRFVGNQKFGKTNFAGSTADLYRTYWCIDPAYSADATADNKTNNPTFTKQADGSYKVDAGFEMITAGTETASAIPAYCHENTFDVARQSHNNTTRIVVAVQMNGGETFYTINGRQDLLYTSQADATSFAFNYIANSPAVRTAVQEALSTPSLEGAINTLQHAEQLLNVSYGRNKEGNLAVTAIGFKATSTSVAGVASVPAFKEGEEEALIANVNDQFKVAEYKNGVNYYNIWVKHFAGSETATVSDLDYDLAPWKKADIATTNTETTTGVNPAYPENVYEATAENNWLGRYGMVRNNWYDINVNKVLHLGTPEITDITVDKTPDDEKEENKWISFTINVLSWAKRVQNIDL